MSMTHDEMIAVIEHHKNGGKVEYNYHSDDRWTMVDGEPLWNFAKHNYRIKPEPMTLWLEISESGSVAATHYTKPTIQAYPHTTLKKFVEVTE
jgi:hypothetical protein